MPRRKCLQVDSLESICIDNICKNMESFWYEKYWKDIYSSPERVLREVGPFEYLSGCLLNEITKKLKMEGYEFQDNIITSLITSTLVKLDLNFRNAFTRRGPLVFDLISLKCGDTLKEMTLYLCEFDKKELLKAIKSLQKLQVLNLDGTQIDDNVLAVIGSHSSELRKLNLNDCNITDKGMEYLFLDRSSVDDINSYGKCKLLESLSIEGTMVGASGIETVLRNASKLQNLDHRYMLCVLERMHCNDLESNLPLYSLTTLHNQCYFNLYSLLSIATRVCPHLMEVILNIPSDRQQKDVLRPLCRVKNLKNLHIDLCGINQPDFFFSEVLPVLSITGHSIRKLLLADFEWVDVGIIGVCCPLLEDLYIWIYDYNGVEESRKEIFIPPASNRKSFTFLKLLFITGTYRYSCTSEDCITPSQWKEMLSSRHLETLEIRNSLSLTDSVLSEVVAAGQEFPNLRELILCECPNITTGFVQSFLNLPNPLEKISVNGCKKITKSDFDSLKSFCKLNGFDVNM